MKLFAPFNARKGRRPECHYPVFLYSLLNESMAKGFVNPIFIFSGIIVLVFLNAGAAFAISAIYDDIEIISQTESELVFRYTPGDSAWSVDPESGGRTLFIKGCNNLNDESLPPLPVKTVALGIPFDSKPVYQILSTTWSGEFPLEYARDKNGISQQGIVEFRPSAIIRSQNTISLNIYPLNISAESGSLLKEITIKITFGNNAFASPKASGYNPEGGFENILSGLLLNYDQARAWRRVAMPSISLEARENIFEHAENWLKVAVTSAGFHKITASDLTSAGIDPASIDPRTFRVFRGGGKPLEVSIGHATPELREVAIHVEGEADGSFDGGDYILFYAPAANFYAYDTDSAEIVYIKNSYTTEGILFLTYAADFDTDPVRMETVNAAPSGSATTIFSYHDMKRFEQDEFLSDKDNLVFDYFRWYWIESIDTFDLYINLDDLTGTGLSRMKMAMAGRSPWVEINGFVPDSIVNNDYRGISHIWSDAFSSGLNHLRIKVNKNIRDSLLDYIELSYQRRIQYLGGTFTFYGTGSAGLYKYRVVGITADSSYTLCEATDMYSPRLLTGFTKEAAARTLEFEYNHASSGFSRFALAENSSINSPSSIEKVEIENILDPGSSYDLIVIAPPEFIPAFGAYRSLREADGYNIFLASIDDVYAHFAGGMFDLVAIRDFLLYTFENWPRPAPAFALLGGDGCYDFLNRTGSAKPNYIPPFIVAADSTDSDENFILFDESGFLDSDSSYPSDRGPDMVIARWPVRTPGEVADFIAKLAGYISGAQNGRWQNTITFVADDEKKPGQTTPEIDHTDQTETLANLYTPDRFDKNKIYLIEYPLDSRGEKPAAKRKLLDAINSGTILVDFIGHGNPRLWTDERIFRNEDIPSLTNKDRLSVIFNASCSIGEFDNPYDEGMAELMFRYTEGGAIATVAATRLVFSSLNANYNYATFDVLFSGQNYTLAEAAYISKFLRQQSSTYIENDRKYMVFGDPLMMVAFPQYNVRFESEGLDSLAALNLVTVAGMIEDAEGGLISDFNGTVDITVYDNQQDKTYFYYYGDSLRDYDYIMPGARIFRGQTDVSGGEFSLQFVVPKDISYGGNNARISAYAGQTQNPQNASGSRDSIRISGTVGEITDTISPEILVYAGEQPLADGLILAQGSHLRVELFDSTGINLSGEVGHRLEIVLNNDPLYTYDLTDEFVYYPGSYQHGEAVITMPELENGNYNLKVKAWDSANNSGLVEFKIAIGAADEPEIVELFNVPNPFADQTRFYYELSTEATAVSMDIFTLAGRKIHSFRDMPGRSGENITDFWNGKDIWGDKLANGIYIYKLSVRAAMGSTDKTIEKFGKMVILR
jgi:hypothetical protein